MIIVACTLAATATGCSRDGDRHLPMPSPSPAADAAAPRERASYADANLGSRIAALDASSSSEETKIGVLEALANDPGDGATSVLLRFVDDPSTLISAASIKGLAARGCPRVEPVLVRLLDDPEWQRRAWAAKVLGTNGCRSAAPALGDRSKREDDDRVKARLKEAMQLLQEVGR
jgi:HEAT repeat protein